MAAMLFLGMSACDDPRLHNVRLTTSQGVTQRFIGANHTYAWGTAQLEPAVGPFGGSFEFSAGHPSAEFILSPRQQELMVFDMPWHLGPEGFMQASRPIDLAGTKGRAYNTILGHGSLQIAGPPGYGGFQALHMVRYWHGECAIRLRWNQGELALFQLIDDGLGKAVACAGKYPVKKDPTCATNSETYFPCPLVPDKKFGQDIASVTMSIDTALYYPHFSSEESTNRMGFFFHNRYEVGVKILGIPLVSASVTMNPTYEVRESSDGFVMVKASELAPTHVVLVPGKNDIKNNVIMPALRDNLPFQLEQQFRKQLTIGLEQLTPAIPPPLQPAYTNSILCDATANRDQQQATCFGQVAANPLLQQFVRNFILSRVGPAGGAGVAFANAESAKFIGGLRPQNFACNRMPDGDFCSFRPIIRRVNVLPNELELVLAADLDSGGAQADNERALYTWLPALALSAGYPLPAELVALCGQTARAPRGVIAEYQRANVTLSEPQTCRDCYGTDPVCDLF